METVYLTYLNLTPGFRNEFSKTAHSVILESLRNWFPCCLGFHEKYPEFELGYTIVTRKGTEFLEVKGPGIMKVSKSVEFAIFLPDIQYSLPLYVDLVFEGIFKSLKKYKVSEEEITKLRDECKSSILP